MEIKITLGSSVSRHDIIRLLNELWVMTQSVTGGDFEIHHDGGSAVSALANAEFDRFGAVRWQ